MDIDAWPEKNNLLEIIRTVITSLDAPEERKEELVDYYSDLADDIFLRWSRELDAVLAEEQLEPEEQFDVDSNYTQLRGGLISIFEKYLRNFKWTEDGKGLLMFIRALRRLSEAVHKASYDHGHSSIIYEMYMPLIRLLRSAPNNQQLLQVVKRIDEYADSIHAPKVPATPDIPPPPVLPQPSPKKRPREEEEWISIGRKKLNPQQRTATERLMDILIAVEEITQHSSRHVAQKDSYKRLLDAFSILHRKVKDDRVTEYLRWWADIVYADLIISPPININILNQLEEAIYLLLDPPSLETSALEDTVAMIEEILIGMVGRDKNAENWWKNHFEKNPKPQFPFPIEAIPEGEAPSPTLPDESPQGDPFFPTIGQGEEIQDFGPLEDRPEDYQPLYDELLGPQPRGDEGEPGEAPPPPVDGLEDVRQKLLDSTYKILPLSSAKGEILIDLYWQENTNINQSRLFKVVKSNDPNEEAINIPIYDPQNPLGTTYFSSIPHHIFEQYLAL